MEQHPNEFAKAATVTSSGERFAFGFVANVIRVSNDAKHAPVFITLTARAASTGDVELRPGETLALTTVRCSSLSAVASGSPIRVWAWGD